MNFKERLKKIKAFAFDVDGVFTDGMVFLVPGNEFMRGVNIKDGYAVQHAVKMGYPIAIISGGKSKAVVERFKKLGVTDIYMGASYKWEHYEDFRMKYGFEHDEISYMGDDMPDYEIMKQVGVAACPADAAHEIRDISLYVSPQSGGNGCVRDIIEQVLRLQNNWINSDTYKW